METIRLVGMKDEGEMWEGCGSSRKKDWRRGVRSTVLEAPPGASHGSPGTLTCIFSGQPKSGDSLEQRADYTQTRLKIRGWRLWETMVGR